MHDVIESVLLTDPEYLNNCDRIDENVEAMTESALEEMELKESYCHEADILTNVDESALDPTDYIDNELANYSDAYPDLIANDDGELIDLVAAVQ